MAGLVLFILSDSHVLLKEESGLVPSGGSSSTEGLFFVTLCLTADGRVLGDGGDRADQMEYLTERRVFFNECLD